MASERTMRFLLTLAGVVLLTACDDARVNRRASVTALALPVVCAYDRKLDESFCFSTGEVVLPDGLAVGDCEAVRTDFGDISGPLGTVSDPEELLAIAPSEDC